jgi:hypothetical protein
MARRFPEHSAKNHECTPTDLLLWEGAVIELFEV